MYKAKLVVKQGRKVMGLLYGDRQTANRVYILLLLSVFGFFMDFSVVTIY